MEEEPVALEEFELSDESDDGFEYGEVSEGEDDVVSEGDEDLETALASLNKEKGLRKAGRAKPAAVTEEHPAVVDDFVRNLLIKLGMHVALDAFNSEWYAKMAKGELNPEDASLVPDIYVRNQQLADQVKELRLELAHQTAIASKAKGTWDKFRKERDFHRMHHKRVVQEKNKLVVDVKRLKKHYESYEPLLHELRLKYEAAMKEKTLMRLERDRLASRVAAAESHLQSLEEEGAAGSPKRSPKRTGRAAKRSAKSTKRSAAPPSTAAAPEGARLPVEDVSNPHLDVEYEALPLERFSLQKTFKGHMNSIANVAYHPKKDILATVSDDCTWKLWSVPNGDVIMSGERPGSDAWLAGVTFHPRGTHLATSSGDGIVKVWDFASATCALTFTDHTQAAWAVAYHHTGDFLASCSMDHTARMWDLTVGRCRQTFRGHVDSINTIEFQPFSNNLVTGSGDKTVSMWDARSGLCVQTFYGHNNACLSVSFNQRGDMIASSDADGVVKLWDVRMVAEKSSMTGGEHALNKVAFDRSGVMLAAASDDGTVKVFNCEEGAHTLDLRGHEDAVQSCVFDPSGKYLVSCGSDNSFRIWSA